MMKASDMQIMEQSVIAMLGWEICRYLLLLLSVMPSIYTFTKRIVKTYLAVLPTKIVYPFVAVRFGLFSWFGGNSLPSASLFPLPFPPLRGNN